MYIPVSLAITELQLHLLLSSVSRVIPKKNGRAYAFESFDILIENGAKQSTPWFA